MAKAWWRGAWRWRGPAPEVSEAQLDYQAEAQQTMRWVESLAPDVRALVYEYGVPKVLAALDRGLETAPVIKIWIEAALAMEKDPRTRSY